MKLSRIAEAAWGIFGKKALGKLACSGVDKYIAELCKQYNVKDNHAQKLRHEAGKLIGYMADCMLNGDDIDTSYVDQQLNGPLADAICKAAYYSNNGDNFISDMIDKLDDSTLSDVERFLLQVGSKTGYDCIKSLRCMLQFVREKVKEEKGEQREEYDKSEPSCQSQNKPLAPQTSKGSVTTPNRNTSVKVHDGMTDKEDQEFVDNLSNDIGNALIKAKSGGKFGPAQMVEMTTLFINKSAEVAKFCEVQKTKRAQIRAQATVAIHQIDAIRDVLKDYLERSFDERRRIFEKEFEVVDKCLANGDTQALAVALNSITMLAQSSPFKALADLGGVRKTLENKGTFDI